MNTTDLGMKHRMEQALSFHPFKDTGQTVKEGEREKDRERERESKS